MAALRTRRISSPAPSESAQSQLLNEDDADEEIGFATQFPLASITQASLTTSSADVAPTARSRTQSRNDANRSPRSESQSQKRSHLSIHRHVGVDGSNSSAESVPFKAFSRHFVSFDENSNVATSHPVDSHRQEESMGSLPLIDQLRAIRKGTNYTRSLGWAKHIESSQQEILDSNDAWQPPLPGRIWRDGTVPVILLEQLSSKANQEATYAKSHRPFVKGAQPLQTRDVTIEPVAIGPVASHEAQPPVTQIACKESLAPEVFVDSQEWPASVSPEPRHVLPPDSSPVQSIPKQKPQHSTATDIDEEFSIITPLDAKDDTLACVGDKGHAMADGQGTIDEHRHSNSSTRLLATSQPKTIMRLSQMPSGTKASNSQHERPNSTGTPPATVQAKQTPFIVKAPPSHAQLLDEPLSSVVKSTYIEDKVSSVTFTHTPLPVKQPSVQISAQNSRDRMQSAVSAHKTHKGPSSQRRGSTHDNTPVRLTQALTSSKRPRQSYGAALVPDNSSATKRRKLPWEDKEDNRQQISSDDYGEIDQRRELLRRQFYKEHSKSCTRLTGVSENGSKPHPQSLESASIGSSPSSNALKALEMSYSSRESPRTAETSSSMHNSPSSDSPFQAAPAVPAVSNSTRTSKIAHAADLLSSYRVAYQSYAGNSKHFHAAIRLLLQLKEENREPHPALWDDFVFRKHSSYRKYLRECIEDGENAMPYEKFYHERVPQPKHLLGVLTPAKIQASTLTPETPYKLPSRNVTTVVSVQGSRHSRPSSTYRKKVGTAKGVKEGDTVISTPTVRLSKKTDQNILFSGKTRTQILTDSSRKVSTWLHRAPGAQSPELGSSGVPEQDDVPANLVALTEDNLYENTTQAEKKPSAGNVVENRRLSRKADRELGHTTASSSTKVLDFVGRYQKLPSERLHLTRGSRHFNIYDW